MISIKDALEFLKLSPRYLLAIALLSGGVLFSPEWFLGKLGLAEFSNLHRQWIGMAFLISTVLYSIYIVSAIWNAGWGTVKKLKNKRSADLQTISRLGDLSEEEKQILRYYLAKQTRTNVLRLENGSVQRLVSARILYRASDLGNLIEGFAFNITDLAWNYINLNPDCLEGATNYYYTDKRKPWYG